MIELLIIPIIVLFAILFFVFWIIMLVDAAKRKFKESSDKVVWILVIIFANFIGALIYYFVVYNKEKSLKWFLWTLLVLAILFVIFVVGFYVVGIPVNVQRG